MAVDERYVDDSFGLADDVLCAHTMSELAGDTLAVLGVGTSQCVYHASVDDLLTFFGIIHINNEEWECWVLSTSQMFPSVYSNYSFNSFATVGGVDYGADDAGIHELRGGTDDGTEISAGILFHPTAFGTTSRKKFRKVFVSAVGGKVVLEATTESGRRLFELKRSEAHVTRDLLGRRWQFAVSGFEVFDFFEAFPIVLVR